MPEGAPIRARIRLWGVRGTCPSPGAQTVRYGGNTPCVEVRSASDELIVLDAGTGLRALGQALDGEIDDRPVHVFLSHRHVDHVMGLTQFSTMISGARDVSIACGHVSPTELRSFVKELTSPPLFPPLSGLTARLAFPDWDVNAGALIGGNLKVRGIAARHPGGATVVVIQDELGAILAYAPDNELSILSDDPTVAAWRDALAVALRDVPVLIHDATYTDAELARHVGWGHSSAEDATRFAVACNASTLLLFHHHPDRRDDEVTEIVMRCREIALSMGSALMVDAAAEGLTLDVRLRETALV